MDNIREGFHGAKKVKDPNKFRDVSLSGDFFCFPEEAITWLESRLEGWPIQDARPLLTAFYSEKGIETPGIEIDDWMMVLKVEGVS